MAKFQPREEDRWVPCRDPNAPITANVVPVVDCAEVSRQFEQYRRSGRFHAGYALSLLQHEADPQVVHESTCPVLNSGDRMALEQYGRAFMGGEV